MKLHKIEFRGKTRLDRRWVYGNLMYFEDGSAHIIDTKFPYTGYDVMPESVGQFTGCWDIGRKNKLYCFDIIELDEEIRMNLIRNDETISDIAEYALIDFRRGMWMISRRRGQPFAVDTPLARIIHNKGGKSNGHCRLVCAQQDLEEALKVQLFGPGYCSCELADRLWNVNTSRCERCGMEYRRRREREKEREKDEPKSVKTETRLPSKDPRYSEPTRNESEDPS